MDILLVNPPNCGRSIPEERYCIDSIKQIFRGEPLALEALAGNLIDEHNVRIVDLKAAPNELSTALADFTPDLVGFTGVTCEANTVLDLARKIKDNCKTVIAVGGIHASNDPEFFNQPQIDYVVVGLGKNSFRLLAGAIESGNEITPVPGIASTNPGRPLSFTPRKYSTDDLVDDKPPAYHLVQQYRPSYKIESLNLNMGFVVTAFGCPYNCSFCCIRGLTDGKYLNHRIESVLRDIRLLDDLPIIRLLDANTFGDTEHARRLALAITEAGIKKQFLADVRSDTVVRHPELISLWQETGLRAVIVGFEEISDAGLAGMNKANKVEVNTEAIHLLHEMGITIIGDFIVSPDYGEDDFALLREYITSNRIDLPMITVMTPLPGTKLHADMKNKITIDDLDYYTLTNAVTPTKMTEKQFYECYAALINDGHTGAKL